MNEQHYTFAKFWKCALQVNPHTYSAQYRGTDHGMDDRTYAEALRDTCLAEEIQIVGIYSDQIARLFRLMLPTHSD